MARIQITQVHMTAGGTRHEHIASVRWVNIDNKTDTGDNTREQIISWILQVANPKNEAWVYGGDTWIEVRVVNANPPYIQTYADGKLTDNLLYLPRY